MCISRILQQNNDHLSRIAWLKAHSPYFPKIFTKNIGGGVMATTLVRKQHEDVWYTIHCVATEYDTDDYTASVERLIERLTENTYKALLFYKITPGREDVDELQVDEWKRLGIKTQLHDA